MHTFDVSVLCVKHVGFEDVRGQTLCELCNLPSPIHSYPGDQASAEQSTLLIAVPYFSLILRNWEQQVELNMTRAACGQSSVAA